MLGKYYRDLLPERAELAEHIRRALAGESFTAVESPLGSTFEGRYSPLQDAEGNVIGMIGVSVDITERVRAEEAVKAERQRFNDVLEMLPAYVVLLTPDYHVPFANRFFRERFGESHGRRCYEYLFGRTEPCETCETYMIMKTHAPHHWEWTGPDGRNYDIYDFPFTDTDGSTLILEMGIDITERKRAAEKVHELSGRMLRAQDEERRRLGRELHDGTAQTLAAASLNLATLNQLLDSSTNPEASKVVAEINQLIDQAWQELRSVAFLLHPPMLEDAGLFAAARWYVEGFVQRTKINVDLKIKPRPERFSRDVELALFRVLQESLSNVYRHSQSPTARVRLASDSGGITLEVSDEGKGLSASAAKGAKGGVEGLGVGISGMRERLRQLGGRLEVRSGKVGVTVRAVIPGDPVRDTLKSPEV
jgi:signal transduction histidine kinase